MTRAKVKGAVAVLATALVLIMTIVVPCSAIESPTEYTEHSTNVFVTFIKDLAEGLKNSFNAFVYSVDGNVSTEFQTAMAYLCTALGVSVVVTIFLIFKRRKTK